MNIRQYEGVRLCQKTFDLGLKLSSSIVGLFPCKTCTGLATNSFQKRRTFVWCSQPWKRAAHLFCAVLNFTSLFPYENGAYLLLTRPPSYTMPMQHPLILTLVNTSWVMSVLIHIPALCYLLAFSFRCCCPFRRPLWLVVSWPLFAC